MISALDARTAKEITSEQPQFLSTIVEAKPSLATSQQLWDAAGDHKREIFESIIRNKDLTDNMIDGIVSALLQSRSEDTFRRALEHWGRKAVFAALNWIQLNAGSMTKNCRDALTFHLDSTLDWVELNSPHPYEALRAAAYIVAPYSSQASNRDTRIWTNAINKCVNHPDDCESLYMCTFFLALGLLNAPPEPLKLVESQFERIYRAAANERLDDSAWEILDPIVPHVSWPNNWDRCERLIRGLISSFVRFNWPPQEMLKCVSSREILDRLPKSAKKVDGGVLFLQRVIY